MSKLAENLVDIFKIVGNDEKLLRLLYYKNNPLDPSKENVKDLNNFNEIRKERILRSPKSNDLTDNKICRICMYFGNGSNTVNNKVSDQDIHFDVFVHIDTYDINDARSLKICDRLNEILLEKRITGMGETRFGRRRIIVNAPDGYIGYGNIYTFGSVK